MKLSTKIIFILFLSVGLILTINGLIMFMSQKNQLQNDLDEKGNLLIERFSKAVAIPIWNMDDTSVDNMSKQELKDSELFKIVITDASNNEYYSIEEDGKKNTFISKKEKILYNDENLGTLTVFFTLSKIKNQLRKSMFFIIVQMVVLFLAIVIVIFFSLKFLVIDKVLYISDFFKKISIGEGDLTVTLEEKSSDEMGILSGNFNNFVGKLRDMIFHLSERVCLSKQIADKVASSTTEITANSNEIRATIFSSKDLNNDLHNEIKSSQTKVELIKKFINEELIEITKKQNNFIDNANSNIEKIFESINEISGKADERIKQTKELVSLGKKGESEMNETIKSINEISQSTSAIEDMMKVINNVSAKTNLLAMNASIEAAHAGDAGKGFSVVAGEIRELAEATGTNVKNISQTLSRINELIKNASDITLNTGKSIKTVISEVESMSEMINGMVTEVRQISNQGNTIIDILKNMVVSTDELNDGATSISIQINNINDTMSNTYRLSNENTNALDEISNAIHEITEAMINLSESGNENYEHLIEIEKEVSGFKCK